MTEAVFDGNITVKDAFGDILGVDNSLGKVCSMRADNIMYALQDRKSIYERVAIHLYTPKINILEFYGNNFGRNPKRLRLLGKHLNDVQGQIASIWSSIDGTPTGCEIIDDTGNIVCRTGFTVLQPVYEVDDTIFEKSADMVFENPEIDYPEYAMKFDINVIDGRKYTKYEFFLVKKLVNDLAKLFK